MFILTPERRFVVALTGLSADNETALASPNSVGQVTIINGAQIVQGNAESPVATELNEGVCALMLTTDTTPGQLLALGAVGQDSQDGDNLAFASLQFQNRVAVLTTGATISTTQHSLFNWRGLPFDRRPMSNVDMEILVNIVTASYNLDFIATIWYQVAQLEPGDVGGLTDSLPVGVRVVRGAQIPSEGVAGPSGMVSAA